MKCRGQLTEVKLNHNNLEIYNNRYIEKVFANVPQKLNRPEDDQMVLDQKVGVLIWRLLMSTMKAAIHLGESYSENLVTYRNTSFEAPKTLFDIRQKLIFNQKHEIKHVSTIEWQFTPWMRSTLLHDKVIKLSKAEVHVYSDSVLSLGTMRRHPDAMVNRKEQLQYFQDSNEYRELSGLDGEPFEFRRTHYSTDSPRDSGKNDTSRNKTGRI